MMQGYKLYFSKQPVSSDILKHIRKLNLPWINLLYKITL
jgi:hypothetical protein